MHVVDGFARLQDTHDTQLLCDFELADKYISSLLPAGLWVLLVQLACYLERGVYGEDGVAAPL
jgi:hypothetical protein